MQYWTSLLWSLWMAGLNLKCNFGILEENIFYVYGRISFVWLIGNAGSRIWILGFLCDGFEFFFSHALYAEKQNAGGFYFVSFYFILFYFVSSNGILRWSRLLKIFGCGWWWLGSHCWSNGNVDLMLCIFWQFPPVIPCEGLLLYRTIWLSTHLCYCGSQGNNHGLADEV